uniref:hypothetical protein n=1 Tax=Flavobacterium sp. TaxID=239 RepID=UPI003B9C631A
MKSLFLPLLTVFSFFQLYSQKSKVEYSSLNDFIHNQSLKNDLEYERNYKTSREAWVKFNNDRITSQT